MLPVQDEQLLTEQQDLQILLLVGSTCPRKEVEQTGEEVGEQEVEHAWRHSKEYADRLFDENCLATSAWSPWRGRIKFPHTTGSLLPLDRAP